MGSGRPRPDELEAQRIVAHVLNLPLKEHDLPGRTSAYDFTIDPNGDPQALEVVRHTDRDRVKSLQAWARYAASGLQVPGLTQRWWLTVMAPASPAFKRLDRALLEPLRAA